MSGTLRRELGLPHVVASGVGIIIGAGIYVLLGAATAQAGPSVWLAFVVAGGLSALTALSYAELAAMFPAAGAEFEYTRRVAPAWIAFLVGWVMVVGLVVAGAAVALGFARYLRHFVDVPVRLGALGLLTVVCTIALRGIRQSAIVTMAFSLVQVGGLVFVAAIGFTHVGEHSLVDGISIDGVVGAAALVFFAFIGFDEVITLSDETRDPARTIPRGLLIALGLATLLYVLVAVSAVNVLGADALAVAEQPLAAVMQTAVGDLSSDLVAVVALIATTNTTLLVVTAASRLQYGMAERGALPPIFARTTGRGVPWVGVAAAIAGGLLGIALGDLTLVASVTDFAVYLVFVAVNVTVIVLRFRQPHRRRPFTVPLSIGWVPLPAVAALIAVAVMLPGLDPAAIALGAILVVVGLGVHIGIRRWTRAATATLPSSVGDHGPMRRRDVTAEEATAVLSALHIDLATVEWDLDQLQRGMRSELEHGRVDPDTNVTDDDLLATAKIALAHLNEIPDYYTRLAAMEAQAFAEQRRHAARTDATEP
jgi:APA family basic amino acid/polyamine antiporter